MSKKILFLSVSLLLALSTKAQETELKISQTYLRMQADAAYSRGDLTTSLAIWTEMIRQDSANTDYYFNRARLLMRMERFDNAAEDCSRILILLPESYQGYWQRAEAHFMQRKLNYAIGDLNHALIHVDNDADKYEILFDRGFCKENNLDYEGAERDYRQILEEYDRKNPKVLNHLGITLNYLEKYEESIQYLSQTILLAPKTANGYISLGFTYISVKQYGRALDLFEQALKLAGGNPKQEAICYSNRGFCKIKLGLFRSGRSDINRAIDLMPQDAHAYRNRALFYLDRGKSRKACADLRLAKEYGFAEKYGEEVQQLIEQHCKND